jgi:hypothetical protein
MRTYDPRVGKFLSVDPLTKKFPSLSPFQYCSDNPVAGIDLDGRELTYYYTKLVKDHGKSRIMLSRVVDSEDPTLHGGVTIYDKNGLSKTINYDVTYSQIGIHAVAVLHGVEWKVLPEGVNLSDLPSFNDPIWNTFPNSDEYQDQVVDQINDKIRTINKVKDAIQLTHTFAAIMKPVVASALSKAALKLETTFLRNKRLAKLASGWRPERFRKGVVEKVWEKAKEEGGGIVRDPKTGQQIKWDGSKPRNWDMGHVDEKSWLDWRRDYENGKITWQELLDEYNEPKNYRPEIPGPNRANNSRE